MALSDYDYFLPPSAIAQAPLPERDSSRLLVLDRRTVPEGDAFACRYEAFWTDPAVEPRKTRWTVELSMLLAK